ncbi:YncE family protein [Corynebacterium bovis]|uniref:YncE family protein n=1 Tax=Corynebacterium bovis TaxID=36808 RepID=UPI00254B04F2|nr:YncE family protein [Corynebacterium bovis]MDK8510887.1 YncE family protein [Corynebacterium bovis]
MTHTPRLRGAGLLRRRIIACATAVAVGAAGFTVAPSSDSVLPVASAQTDAPRPGTGKGTLQIVGSPTVPAGGIVRIKGSGFEKRDGNQYQLAVKLDDGAIPLPTDQEGADLVAKRPAHYGTKPENLPGDDGTFTMAIRLPADLTPGTHWIRILGGSDGGPVVSKFVEFTVPDPSAPPAPAPAPAPSTEAPAPAPQEQAQGPSVTASVADINYRGTTDLAVSALGFTPSRNVRATVDGKPVALAKGAPDAPVAAEADGTVTVVVSLAPGVAPAGVHTLVLTGEDGRTASTPFLTSAQALVKATPTSRAGLGVPLGTKGARVELVNAAPGSVIESVTVGAESVPVRDVTPATDKEPASAVFDVPTDQAIVGDTIGATFRTGDTTQETSVGATVTLAVDNNVGARYETTKNTELPRGVYQVRTNPKTGEIFVTQSVGRGKDEVSALLVLDPATLQIKRQVTIPNDGTGRGVFGLGLDNQRGLVWATDTRANTVMLFKQDTLELVKDFPKDSVLHSRDVIVDETTGRAYVSSAAGPRADIAVFDGETKEQLETISVSDDRTVFNDTMSLDFDPKTGALYTVSLNTPAAARIDVRNGNKVTIYQLPKEQMDRASGVAWDPDTQRLYVVGQTSNSVLVYDVREGKVIRDIRTGVNPLNAAYDPVYKRVYVTNFGGSTVTIIDADSMNVIGQLDAGATPNHVAVEPDGTVNVVSRVAFGNDGTKDAIYRYVPKDPKPTPPPAGSVPSGSIPVGSLPNDTQGLLGALVGVIAGLGVAGVLATAVGALIGGLPGLPPLPGLPALPKLPALPDLGAILRGLPLSGAPRPAQPAPAPGPKGSCGCNG